jgi:hypothetical protein
MAKINTYPVATPAIDDELLGTDISDTGNDANGETVQFTLESLRDLFVKGKAQCYFQYTSSTICTLVRKNGAHIQIAGELHEIPSAGVTLGTGGLSNGTTYYVYVYDNAGTLTLEASTTGWAFSTTAGNEGVPIKSGDNTRTLVGMAYFQTTFYADLTISYWNKVRRVNRFVETSILTTTSTGAWVAIGTPVYFLHFSNSPNPRAFCSGGFKGSGLGVVAYARLYLDGTTAQPAVLQGGNQYDAFCCTTYDSAVSEGRRYYQLFGIVGSGTGTYGITNTYPVTQVEFWG